MAYLFPNNGFLHLKYAKKGFYTEFAQQGSFVCILWINEVGGTCKTNIKMALKPRSYILDLDNVKLSLGISFFLRSLMAFRIYLIFCQKHTPEKLQILGLSLFHLWKWFLRGSLEWYLYNTVPVGFVWIWT